MKLISIPQYTQYCFKPKAYALYRQLARFFVAGGLTTLMHWGLMAVLIRQTVSPFYATITGAVLSSVVNYLFQFHWVFKGKHHHRQVIPRYASTVILGWCLNAAFFYLLSTASSAGTTYVQFYTTLIVAIISFITYKRIVFHERTI